MMKQDVPINLVMVKWWFEMDGMFGGLSIQTLEFKQELEADFGASQYLVYPQFDRKLHIWPKDRNNLALGDIQVEVVIQDRTIKRFI